jgi:hypothetical protein
MAEKSAEKDTFPRRDADGRYVSLVELTVVAVVGALVSFGAVALIDWLMSLADLGTFGAASGWLAAVLPIFVFLDDFRAWRDTGKGRWIAAAVAIPLSVGAGLVLAGTVDAVALISGAVGALTLVVFYSVLWFIGVRLLTGSLAEGASR